MTGSALDGKTILIVDDEPDVLAVLEAEIMDACRACRVEKAGTYEGAAKMLESETYDVVILDIHMPEGNGLDVLHTIKQDGVGRMVIILTNYPYPGYRQKCLQAGADFFLDKSAEFDQIPALVEQLKQGSGFDQAQPG